jgi:ABC-type glycerol-3-phosphate transport system substrate-binding protein
METMLGPSTGNSHPESNGLTWEKTQMYFMLGRAAMFPNGDWNNLEMEKSFPESDILFMRLPVISSLGAKLGITEAQLVSVIDYVDSLSDGGSVAKPSFVPIVVDEDAGALTLDEVIEKVYAARTITFSYANYHTAFAASYGLGLESAKKFLTFMASNKGSKIYAKAMSGPTLPFGYDIAADPEIWNGLNNFAKTRWTVAKNASYYYIRNDLPLGKAGLGGYMGQKEGPIEVLVSRAVNPRSAQYIFDLDYAYFNNSTAWTDLLRRAGLI